MKHLKQEFDKLTFKEALMYAITITSLTAGFVILFCGMFIPPEGEIHDSVLMAFGMVLVFVGSTLGLDIKYSNATKSFQRTILEMLVSHGVIKKEEAEKKTDINLEKKGGGPC